MKRIGMGGIDQRGAILRHLRDRAAARLGVRGGAGRGVPEVQASELYVDTRGLIDLLDVTRAEGVDPGRGDLPGWIPGLWEAPLVPDLLRVAGYPFPFRGVLNLGVQRAVVARPQVGMPLGLKLTLTGSEPIRTGERMTIDSVLSDSGGSVRIQSRIWMLFRRRPTAERRAGKEEEKRDLAGREIAVWDLNPEDARRYAELTGDRNPVHMGGPAGRLLGFRQPILHGYCLEGLVWNALEATAGEIDSLRIRFEKPISLPGAVRLEMQGSRGSEPASFRAVGEDGTVRASGYFTAPGGADQG